MDIPYAMLSLIHNYFSSHKDYTMANEYKQSASEFWRVVATKCVSATKTLFSFYADKLYNAGEMKFLKSAATISLSSIDL